MSEVEAKVKKVKKTEAVKEEPVVSKVVPKIFMKKDEKIKVEVTCFFSKETGDMILVLPKEMASDNSKENIDNVLIREDFEFVFSKVPYDKLNIYRSRSMIYNSEDKNNTINNIRLRNFLLIFHLQDWNLKDEEGNKIELKFDPNGALTDESLKLIYNLPSNLLDLVLATYEKRMNIF